MRKFFPFFSHNPTVVYLDSAATSLKLGVALAAQRQHEEELSSNAVRGLYPLAEKVNQNLDEARQIVAEFLSGTAEEIIFTSGTTHGINLVTNALEESLEDGGEILLALDNHHSNLLPWTRLAKQKKLGIKTLDISLSGTLSQDSLQKNLTPQTKIVVLTLVSNVYGVKNDIPALVNVIRAVAPQAFVFLDAAQAVAHMQVDAKLLGVDALVFSGHKAYAPTGAGVLWLCEEWQQKLAPGFLGGGMVQDVTKEEWKSGPEKFEAGTLPLGPIMGLAAALTFITQNRSALQENEEALLSYAFQQLGSTCGNTITLLGSQDPQEKVGLISFVLAGVHPHDIASLLGEQNICVRAGEHCASPLHQSLGLPATTRISFGAYTTKEDIDALVTALKDIVKLFQKSSSP